MELGKKLADEFITRHQSQTGEFLSKIGFDLSAATGVTFPRLRRDGGPVSST